MKTFKKLMTLFCSLLAVVLVGAWNFDDPLEIIQSKFDNYRKKYPAVKINLVFNQPIYSPGDTVFFSAWYHDEEFVAVQGGHIIALDLYGIDGQLSQHSYFKVHNGRGYNQIILKDNLEPGEYQLHVYSDWMKNFDSNWFFKRTITVVGGKQMESKAQSETQLKFYPEGGNLIEGIVNRVVVLGPPSTELTIQNPGSETVKASIDSTGMGIFEITPHLNHQYFAKSSVAGDEWPLPLPTIDGLSVRMLQHHDSSFMKLSIAPHATINKEDLYAVVTSAGRIVIKQKIDFTENETIKIQMPRNENNIALHQLFVLNMKGRILAQRVFVPNQGVKVTVRIEAQAMSHQREQVPYKVAVFDANGNELESDLAVSIIQEGLFEDYSLYDNFYFSDLPELIAHSQKFTNQYKSSLNDFLITQKWERITWGNILGDKSPEIIYPFKKTLTLKGKLTSKATGLVAPDSTLVMGYLQKNLAGYEVYSKNGYFEIPFDYDFFGEDQIFCTAQIKSKNIDNEYTISVLTDSVNSTESNITLESSSSSPYGKYAQAKRLVTNSFSFFEKDHSKDLRSSQSRNALFEDEFMGADNTVVLSDYVVFSSMKDIIHEVVPFVQYHEKGGQESIRMIFKYNGKTISYNNGPLYVIDGVMSRNTTSFLGIKPADIITIKIINSPNKLAQLGKLGENGVILVETKNDNLAKALLKENHFPVVGLSYPIEFPAFENHKFALRRPDLRSTLYWNPQLATDKTGQAKKIFVTSDDVGKMMISVQGLTKDHHYFSFEQAINVGYNPARE